MTLTRNLLRAPLARATEWFLSRAPSVDVSYRKRSIRLNLRTHADLRKSKYESRLYEVVPLNVGLRGPYYLTDLARRRCSDVHYSFIPGCFHQQ